MTDALGKWDYVISAALLFLWAVWALWRLRKTDPPQHWLDRRSQKDRALSDAYRERAMRREWAQPGDDK